MIIYLITLFIYYLLLVIEFNDDVLSLILFTAPLEFY